MVGPITNDYISATHKSFISNNTDGNMIEKNFIEIERTFLLKISYNVFKGINGENVFEHINSFLEVVEPLKVRGLSHDRFRLSVFPISLSEEAEDDDDPDKIDKVSEIFKIKDDLFNFDTPLCIAFEEFNYLLKIDPDLFTYDIQEFKTYDEYEQDLIDGFLKEETLIHKAQIEGSWGDATPGVLKFCTWLKNSFENFHELDYNVLVKLEECWWKVNTDEIFPFTRWDDHLRGPYANAEPNRTSDPYLDNDRMSKRNYETNNGINVQVADEEYVAIKEIDHINHSETNMDARYAYRELFRKMDDGWLITRGTDE
ncbi:hypothetical protein Tco_0853038 [Tanacetum coccineum]